MTTAIGLPRYKWLRGESATGLTFITHGGPGSGDYGHSGRPGERGGSEPGHGGPQGGQPHGEHEEAEHPLGSNLMHVAHEAGDVAEVVRNLPRVAARFLIPGSLRAAQAGTAEGVEHSVKALHGAVSKAHEAHEAAHGVATSMEEAGEHFQAHAGTGGEHGAGGHEGMHGGHGEHEAGHALGAFAEAAGAILGSKVAGHLERSKTLGLGKSIDHRAHELFEKMKQEHGAAAPYLHAAATAAALGLKMSLAHALAGPAGAIAGTAFGGFSEHIVEAATEGIQGLTGFSLPGVGFATLLAAHGLGKMLNATGITSTKLAKKAGDLHRKVAGSKAVQTARHVVHHVEKHLEHLTGLHLFKEGKHIVGEAKAIGSGAVKGGKVAAKLAAKGGKKLWAGLQAHPQEVSAPGYLGVRGSRMALPQVANYFLINADTVTGKAPVAGKSLDLNSPAIQLVIELLRHSISALMKTPLWDKLNTPEGRDFVVGLLAPHHATT